MDQPAFYQIHVEGKLDDSWSDWLGGLAITPLTGGVTLLAGFIIDQAALHGTLDKLYAMNLRLLYVNRIEGDTQDQEQMEYLDG